MATSREQQIEIIYFNGWLFANQFRLVLPNSGFNKVTRTLYWHLTIDDCLMI